jgi:hypothetical protein
MTVLARSKARIFGRPLAGIASSNPVGGMDTVLCECCVLSARSLCDGPFAVPEESYGVRARVRECVISYNSKLYTCNEWVDMVQD